MATEQLSMLDKNTVKLQDQLSVLQLALRQEGISSVRLARTLQAMNHLVTEIHLLVISTLEK